jgi:hypothetical protein
MKLLIIKIKNLRTKISDQENDLNFLYTEINKLTIKENEAIDNNDFDEAHNIEIILCDKRNQAIDMKKLIEESQKEMILFREEELIIIKNKQRILEEGQQNFKIIKLSQENELENFQNDELNTHKNDNIKIIKLKKKLDIIKNNLDTDKTVK